MPLSGYRGAGIIRHPIFNKHPIPIYNINSHPHKYMHIPTDQFHSSRCIRSNITNMTNMACLMLNNQAICMGLSTPTIKHMGRYRRMLRTASLKIRRHLSKTVKERVHLIKVLKIKAQQIKVR